MADLIIGLIIVVAVGAAIRYIYKAKKSGAKCIGCPDGAACGSKTEGSSSCGCYSCGCHSDEDK